MNAQVRRLFFVLVGLFVALIAMTTYWLWKAPDLEARQGNPQLIVQQLDDRPRARSSPPTGGRASPANRKVRKKQLGRTWYLRTLSDGRARGAHAVGYSTIERSRTGLEESMNDYLTGSNANLDTLFDNTLDKLRGITQRGNDVVTTIDATRPADRARAPSPATAARAVALDPQTGRVLVWASQPTYDPNLVEGHFDQIQRGGRRALHARRAAPRPRHRRGSSSPARPSRS